MGLLDDLNPAQKEAAGTTSGPVLVLAGAGSGKTRVLTYRIAHLIRTCDVLPWRILAVTFTNKAAGEMRDRVVDLVGPDSRDIWLGTFHAICAKILRYDGDKLGVDSRFTIYDEDDRRALVRTVVKNLDIDSDDLTPRAVAAQISRAKNSMIDAPRFLQEAGNSYRKQQVAEVYTAYQQALQQHNAMDFDDLLVELVRRLQDHGEVLTEYQSRFEYILIDEYQDTNRPQYLLTRLLAKKHRNICCVGDDDQSIYQFRGADIRNILDFERDYPDAKTVRLEQNYRSTGHILAAANAVIQNNQSRKGKSLWTERSDGDPIELFRCTDDRGEARHITETICRHLASPYTPADITVLYRTNAQSRPLEQELQSAGIKYEIVGGLRFYERKEIKDLLAYLRILVNPADDISTRRIVNVPKRGIGDTTLRVLAEHGRQHRLSLLDSLDHLDEIDALNSRAKKQLKHFRDLISQLRQTMETLDLPGLGVEVCERSSYRQMLQSEGTPEAEVREQNMNQLIADMTEFSQEEETPTLTEFMEAKSLMSSADERSDSQEAVTLMTLHSAKGLEYPVVFICGMEEDLFPTARSLEEARVNPESLEEERRLFYVGITRARQRLYLSYAERRFVFGAFREMTPSRFVDELPDELLHKNHYLYESYTSQRKPRKPLPTPPKKKNKQGIHYEWDDVPIASHDYPEVGDDFLSVGNWVLHSTWGRGRIEASEGFGADLKLSIRFANNQVKKVAVAYAQLEPA